MREFAGVPQGEWVDVKTAHWPNFVVKGNPGADDGAMFAHAAVAHVAKLTPVGYDRVCSFSWSPALACGRLVDLAATGGISRAPVSCPIGNRYDPPLCHRRGPALWPIGAGGGACGGSERDIDARHTTPALT